MSPRSTNQQWEAIAALLREESTLALATADEHGVAGVAPLFYIADEQLALYWLSSPESLHSRNLQRNPLASAAIFRPTADWRQICGVQMRGPVEAIIDPERRKALVRIYWERFQLSALLRPAVGRSTVYALRPQWFRFIDNTRHFGYQFELTRDGDD
jgi:uncharacterized protein YhbP (UPF0306 family)